MDLSIRGATPDDADALVEVIDLASEGVVPALWSAFAEGGASATDIGRAMVLEPEGAFSFRNGHIAEQNGETVGGMIDYPMTAEAVSADAGLPEFILPLVELEALVVGRWYVNFMAVLPSHRCQGIGTALLAHVEARARAAGSSGLALIVAASNTVAHSLYLRSGYVEAERRDFDVSPLGHAPTEAILMVKEL